MAGSPNPRWNDSAGGFPPANPPTADSILGQFIHDVPDPLLSFHDETTIKAWFRTGQQMYAAAAVTNACSGPKGKRGIPRDHALVAALLAESGATAFTADEADVALPDDCYLLLEAVVYPGEAHEAVAAEIPWSWDFRARNHRQYMPTAERPLVALHAGSKAVRFYIAGGITADAEFLFRYLRIPSGTFLDPDDANAEKSDLPDPFNRGPLCYALARWYASRETDPAPFFTEFAADLQSKLPPATSAEAAS